MPEAVARRCSVKKVFLKNLAKLTGKHLNTFSYKTSMVAAFIMLQHFATQFHTAKSQFTVFITA